MNNMNKKLRIPVEEFTTPNPVTAHVNDSYEVLRNILAKEDFRHLPIVDDSGAVVGIISQRDLNLIEGLGRLNRVFVASDLMRKDPFVVDPSTPLEDVVFELSSRKIGSAIVSNVDEDYLGIFTSTDAMNALIEIARQD